MDHPVQAIDHAALAAAVKKNIEAEQATTRAIMAGEDFDQSNNKLDEADAELLKELVRQRLVPEDAEVDFDSEIVPGAILVVVAHRESFFVTDAGHVNPQ